MLPPLLIELFITEIDADSRAAWLLFLEIGVKFKLHKVTSNETLELGHLPSGWPILKDIDFYVAEGNTILRYISSKLDLKNIYYPKELKTRTNIDIYLDWSKNNLLPMIERVLIVSTNYSPQTHKLLTEKHQQYSVEEIGLAVKDFIDSLKELESLFLNDKEYMVGDRLTIADIHAACHLSFSQVLNIDFTSIPKLSIWLEKIQKQLKGWDIVNDGFNKFVIECVKQQKMNQAHEQKMKKHGKDAAGGTRQPDVYHTVYFQKPPNDVWIMLTKSKSWEYPQGKELEFEFNEKAGGQFSYHNSIEGTNLYLQTNHRILQSWRHIDWPVNISSTVRINVESDGGNGTQLILLQQDIPPSFIKKTDELWNTQFWKPMGGVLVRNILRQIFFDNLSPHSLYNLMTDSQAFAKLTRTKCEIGRGVGTNVNLLDNTITGKNVELITDVKIVQSLQFGVDGWPVGHFSKFILEISRVAGGTTVIHTQENVPVGNFRQITELFEKSIFKRMQRWNEDT